ncbi:MAG: beta-galactosidase [Parvularculaceae bacterium]|nr:beta-galactosidase [Parvularculaceae bacterium]
MAGVAGLGVCYYPEQWPQTLWRRDAERMAALGLSFVRIGEFAWSRIEPDPGRFDWGWLDEAVETLAAARLKIVLGTPTATPPKWLIDAHPDILGWGADGRPRRFGSRRHYCFSSETYRRETARIVEAVATRYGRHEAVVAWQTDNEFGCHDTVRSYSPAAATAFRHWLASRYASIRDLNAAWGAAFWSQDYRAFDEVDPPNLTVTEPNPAHVLDFFRFSSDQVARYHRLQAEILRRLSPGRDVIHNFMGFFTDFDHLALGRDVDVAAWDSYPLGFLDMGPYDDAEKLRFLRQGHPDLAAFHHDLYRRVGRGRWMVMEQQPGPVNWARHNPAPLPGMVRLWTHEAFAHGAEAVSYFRWRQAPFAQEQMHAGILRSDDAPAPAHAEAALAAREIAATPAKIRRAPVALVFSYEAKWVFDIQSQGAAFGYWRHVLDWYSAARRLGFDVDILSPEDSFDGFALVLAPSLPILPEGFAERAQRSSARFLFGPRTGSKTAAFQIPPALPPGELQALLPMKIVRVESFPPQHMESGEGRDGPLEARLWLEHVETTLAPEARLAGGVGVLYQRERFAYLASVVDAAHLGRLIARLACEAGLSPLDLGPDLRMRRSADRTTAVNYGPEPVELPSAVAPSTFVLGDRSLPPAGVAAWSSGSD